mmetsp:Transcript_54187/g.100116  ORF Transcript_54187/g.100116 Transcript_54187/m.100116 type:complete len:525 (-) Transcript_54187:5-1579(-)
MLRIARLVVLLSAQCSLFSTAATAHLPHRSYAVGFDGSVESSSPHLSLVRSHHRVDQAALEEQNPDDSSGDDEVDDGQHVAADDSADDGQVYLDDQDGDSAETLEEDEADEKLSSDAGDSQKNWRVKFDRASRELAGHGHAGWLQLWEKQKKLWLTPNHRLPSAMRRTVPYTVLYIMETAGPKLWGDDPPKHLSLHFLGATYLYEGRSDWKLLHRMLKKHFGVESLEVLLDLAEPFKADNTVQVDTPEAAKDGYEEAADKPLQSERWSKEKACASDARIGLKIDCKYGLYQDVLKEDKAARSRPNLIFMVNPGLGQLVRRSWDWVLRYTLKHNIPTVISTQTASQPGYAGAKYDVLAPGDTRENNDLFADETFASATVMHSYGAHLLQSSVSPFPLVRRFEGSTFWKNSVLAVYKGLRPGMHVCTPEAISEDERKWMDAHTSVLEASWMVDMFDGKFSVYMSLPACPAYDEAVQRIATRSKLEAPSKAVESFLGWNFPSKGRLPVWDWARVIHDLYREETPLSW